MEAGLQTRLIIKADKADLKVRLYDECGACRVHCHVPGGTYAADAVTDPQGPGSGRARIVRGGSFGDDPENLRVSNRTPNQPGSLNVNVGFRCARDVKG